MRLNSTEFGAFLKKAKESETPFLFGTRHDIKALQTGQRKLKGADLLTNDQAYALKDYDESAQE